MTAARPALQFDVHAARELVHQLRRHRLAAVHGDDQLLARGRHRCTGSGRNHVGEDAGAEVRDDAAVLEAATISVRSCGFMAVLAVTIGTHSQETDLAYRGSLKRLTAIFLFVVSMSNHEQTNEADCPPFDRLRASGVECRRTCGIHRLSRLRQFHVQCVPIAMSYTAMTRNSSSPFSTPGSRPQLKKTFGVGERGQDVVAELAGALARRGEMTLCC